MRVELWAEIRRLHHVDGLSQRAIALRKSCCRRTVQRALAMDRPPQESKAAKRGSSLDRYKPRIDALLAQSPELSAVRIWEEIRRGPEGFAGSVILVRRYLRQVRPPRQRIYQEVHYEPGQAMQVDWGHCGQIQIENTARRVSVLVAVLCYSRLCYIEFTLSQRKAEFYRAIVHALEFFGGSPRRIIFDNLKAAVLNGSGREACLHPEFLALCGHFYLEPVACARRDPESKGIVEAGVRYVKHNALQGRAEQLTCWQDYQQLASSWRDQVANVRIHQSTRQRPIDRFQQERSCLRKLPGLRFDTDEIVSAIVSSHARVQFDGNRYSTPPEVVGKSVILRADTEQLRLFYEGQQIATHQRCYGRGQLVRQAEHQLQALQQRRRAGARQLETTFDALGEAARQFHLKLQTRPVKTGCHLRRLINLAHLYGRDDVLAAIRQALQYQTYDAAYVEALLLQERRRRELPSPTPLRPRRQELMDETDFPEPDPAAYDRFLTTAQEQEEQPDDEHSRRTAPEADGRATGAEADADR